MKNPTFHRTACCAFLLTAIAGCGGGTDHPPTVPATGTVTLNGKPVAGATIAFTGASHTALAISGDDGRFELTTFTDGDGAVEGDYRVTVVKMISGGSGAAGDQSMEAAAAASEKQQEAANAQSALASRYGDPLTSGLQFTVKKGEENDFALQLNP